MDEFVQWGRFVLATVFLLAGVAKLGNRGEFAKAVAGYRLVPPGAAAVVARVLPPAEVALAVLLFAGVAVRVVAALLGTLLLVFTAAVTVNLARGRRIECGCFGATVERELTWWTVARNIGLAALAAVVASRGSDAAVLPTLMLGTLTVVAALLGSAWFTVAGRIRRIGAI